MCGVDVKPYYTLVMMHKGVAPLLLAVYQPLLLRCAV